MFPEPVAVNRVALHESIQLCCGCSVGPRPAWIAILGAFVCHQAPSAEESCHVLFRICPEIPHPRRARFSQAGGDLSGYHAAVPIARRVAGGHDGVARALSLGVLHPCGSAGCTRFPHRPDPGLRAGQAAGAVSQAGQVAGRVVDRGLQHRIRRFRDRGAQGQRRPWRFGPAGGRSHRYRGYPGRRRQPDPAPGRPRP